MEWLTVLSLIVVGIILIVVEIILVPGTTIVGIAGLLLTLTGLVLGFRYFGSTTGYILLASSAAVSGGALYWSLRARAWDRFSLKSTIDGRVNEGKMVDLQVGMEGTALSSLRPSGKADFNGRAFEVTTYGNYVESGSRVRIINVNIASHRIIVEPVNET